MGFEAPGCGVEIWPFPILWLLAFTTALHKYTLYILLYTSRILAMQRAQE